MTMEEVGAEGRYPFRREQVLLEDIAPEAQQQFLSVTAGEVLEPIESEGAFRLYRVMAKKEPSLEDAAVRQRVERRILERHFEEAAEPTRPLGSFADLSLCARTMRNCCAAPLSFICCRMRTTKNCDRSCRRSTTSSATSSCGRAKRRMRFTF